MQRIFLGIAFLGVTGLGFAALVAIDKLMANEAASADGVRIFVRLLLNMA